MQEEVPGFEPMLIGEPTLEVAVLPVLTKYFPFEGNFEFSLFSSAIITCDIQSMSSFVCCYFVSVLKCPQEVF